MRRWRELTVVAAMTAITQGGCQRAVIYCEGELAPSPDGQCTAQLVQDVATDSVLATEDFHGLLVERHQAQGPGDELNFRALTATHEQ